MLCFQIKNCLLLCVEFLPAARYVSMKVEIFSHVLSRAYYYYRLWLYIMYLERYVEKNILAFFCVQKFFGKKGFSNSGQFCDGN